MKLSIVIPAYNEERTIHLILDKVKTVQLIGGLEKELILVNDCSKDDTEGAILKYKAANPDLNIEIVGHMDKVEEKSSLKDLSVDRAKAVYDYLIKNGIDASRLSYKGMKSSAPLDDSGTQDSLAKNRRVNLIVK